jgi:hypothetical protein
VQTGKQKASASFETLFILSGFPFTRYVINGTRWLKQEKGLPRIFSQKKKAAFSCRFFLTGCSFPRFVGDHSTGVLPFPL